MEEVRISGYSKRYFNLRLLTYDTFTLHGNLFKIPMTAQYVIFHILKAQHLVYEEGTYSLQ